MHHMGLRLAQRDPYSEQQHFGEHDATEGLKDTSVAARGRAMGGDGIRTVTGNSLALSLV